MATRDDGQGGQSDKTRLIAICTHDFEDKEDANRVLNGLPHLGIVKKDKPIYYKADALSHLDIMSGNPYGRKPTILEPGCVQGKSLTIVQYSSYSTSCTYMHIR